MKVETKRCLRLPVGLLSLLALALLSLPECALGVDDVAVSPAGKILVAGRDPGKFTLAMLNSDGSIDTGFGDGGTVVNRFGADATLQRDGKVVVTGGRAGKALLYRYRKDGRLDRSFGSKKMPGRARAFVRRPKAATVDGQGVLVKANGQILVAAFYECFGADPGCGYTQDYFHLLRFTPRGRLLGSGQIYGGDVYGLSRAPQGKTLVIGTANENDWTVAARFTRRGQADHGFGDHGHDGWSVLSFVPAGLAAQRDGSPVIAMEGGIARLTPRGILDKGFGSAGIARCPAATPAPTPGLSAPFPYEPFDAVKVRRDQSLIAMGRGCGLIHLTQQGLIDSSFGTAGRAEVPPGDFDSPQRIALQADGSILVAALAPDRRAFLISRFSRDGRPDPSFGAGGMTSVPIEGTSRH